MQRVTRRFTLTASLLCAALLANPVSAQTPNLTLEQRHVIKELIKELVKELKVESANEDLKIAAGDELPGKVVLQPVPPLIGQKVPSIRAHRLYVTQRQVLIVDPQDRKVVEVIE